MGGVGVAVVYGYSYGYHHLFTAAGFWNFFANRGLQGKATVKYLYNIYEKLNSINEQTHSGA